MHLGVLGGQALVGPAEALGGEHDPVTQTGELGEQLVRTGGQNHVVAAEIHFLFGSERVGAEAPPPQVASPVPEQTERRGTGSDGRGELPVHEHYHKLRLL